MRIHFSNFLLLAAVTGLWSCSQNLQFSNDSKMAISGTDPVVVPTLPPDPDLPLPPAPSPLPNYSKTSGNCAADSSTALTSCLKCQIPQDPPPQPQLSQKAQYLLDIMTLGCSVANGSDPKPFTPPTREQILNYLNRCSPTAYKDTTASSEQQSVIDGLLAADPALRYKMFHGLYYQPPYSDRFETFFGIEMGEARHMFCYRDSFVSGAIYDIGYYHQHDPSSYVMPALYVQANAIRDDLKRCARQSLQDPWKPTAPPVSNHGCQFETLAGPNGLPVSDQITKWLALGWQISAEAPQQGLCLSIHSSSDILNIVGDIKIAANICH